MKTLHPKGPIIGIMAACSIVAIVITLIGVAVWYEQGTVNYDVFICAFGPILMGVYFGLREYCTHWIQYGEGKVIIKRVSKKYKNGMPKGWWKNNKDEFRAEDIVRYGSSGGILGHPVEWHRDSGRFSVECFFELKDGKRIGYETTIYLAKDMEEFFDYIVRETGLESAEKLWWNNQKQKSR